MGEGTRDEISGFVERFAATLADSGFPRLAARVFARLLVSESGRMTAAELAEELQASTGLGDSPAADRLTETLELIQFLKDETRAMMRRWQDRKAALRTRQTADPS